VLHLAWISLVRSGDVQEHCEEQFIFSTYYFLLIL